VFVGELSAVRSKLGANTVLDERGEVMKCSQLRFCLRCSSYRLWPGLAGMPVVA
jgi:hypothetical protein